MENSKQELLVQSLATSPRATVTRDLGLFNGELVVIRKLLSRYNPAGETGKNTHYRWFQERTSSCANFTWTKISLAICLCANSHSKQFIKVLTRYNIAGMEKKNYGQTLAKR